MEDKKINTYFKSGYIENSGHVCDYGCEQIAHYQFKNEKWCCSQNFSQCPVNKNKIRKGNIGKKRKPFSKEHKQKIGEFSSKRVHTEKTRKKMSKIRKGKIRSLEYWEKKHPLFCKVEELRNDPITGKVQGHCKNHNCENSKEKNGWFTLSKHQIENRYGNLESENGNGASYFYCSHQCKTSCDLFGKSADQIMRDDLIRAGHIDIKEIPGLEIWRNEVFKRNKKEYNKNQCEICGSISNLIGHHIYPQKSHQHMALDPNNGLVVCHECHTKKCHPKGTSCSYGELAKLRCEKIYRERKENGIY